MKMLTKIGIYLILSSVIFLLPSSTFSQSEGGTLSFGFNVGGAKYWGDFTDNQFWLAGDVFFRYNLIPELSLTATVGLAQIRWKNSQASLAKYPEYFGAGADYGQNYPNAGADGLPKIRDKSGTRLSTYEVTASWNLYPSESFVPYLFGGVGWLNFEPQSGDTGWDGPLQNNLNIVYDKGVLVFPVGIGFEFYMSDKFVVNAKASYRITSTDYLDDLSGVNSGNDNPKEAWSPAADADNDAFMTFGAGFSYYILGNNDWDDDGLTNSNEREIGTDPYNPDSDADGLKDGEEVLNYKTNPMNPDTDMDGLKDGEEVITYKTDPLNPDTDGDGLKDGEEVNRYRTEPLVADTDADGLSDGDEVIRHKTDPIKSDTDSDGLKDGDEINRYKTDPLNADTDNDGLNDGDEISKYKTDPLKADTDADGLSDGDEVLKFKTDPTKPDTDGDGLTDGDEVKIYRTDPLKTDTDNDKLSDSEEIKITKTDPLNPDTDGDGVIDGEDDCPHTPGVKSSVKGRNGCPLPPKVGTKTDFPDILFKVNTDEFNYDYPGTSASLVKLLDYVKQCPGLEVIVEGHASVEGDSKRNQELSDMRAKRVKNWLIEQGANSNTIKSTIGYGSRMQKVKEPTGAALKKISAAELEAIRKQNRRMTIEVVRSCDYSK